MAFRISDMRTASIILRDRCDVNNGMGTIERRAIADIDWTMKVVAAYVSHNSVPASELPSLIGETHAAFARLVGERGAPAPHLEMPTPTQIRESITADALISFEDGKPYKMLKRHLVGLGLTPEAYRRKWGLPNDYPMTAQNFSAQRSALAKISAPGSSHRISNTRNDHAAAPHEAPQQSASSRPGPGAGG